MSLDFKKIRLQFSKLGQTIRSLSKTLKFVIFLIMLAILLTLGVKKYKTDRYYSNLTKELKAEEGDEPENQSTATDADFYVNDFKYAVDIMIDPNGFTPSAVNIKPNTKLIFKTKDTMPHFVLVSPGGKVPKYFAEKDDITKDRLYQTKLEDIGVYGFYDKHNPEHSLTVVVTE